MGGLGSTRWRRHRKAVTVEDCQGFNLERLLWAEALIAGTAGTLRWRGGGAARFVVHADGESLAVLLRFLGAPPGGLLGVLLGLESAEVEQTIRLASSPTPRGRRRWWLLCPLGVGGPLCGRGALHLYRPPGEQLFGCRSCHGLTYASSQRSHARPDSPAGCLRALGGDKLRRSLSRTAGCQIDTKPRGGRVDAYLGAAPAPAARQEA
jgi:hypothetical protein